LARLLAKRALSGNRENKAEERCQPGHPVRGQCRSFAMIGRSPRQAAAWCSHLNAPLPGLPPALTRPRRCRIWFRHSAAAKSDHANADDEALVMAIPQSLAPW